MPDPSPCCGDLLVAPALQALLEILYAAPRKNRMRVRVDKTRHENAAPAFNPLCFQASCFGLQLPRASHAEDPAAPGKHRSARIIPRWSKSRPRRGTGG